MTDLLGLRQGLRRLLRDPVVLVGGVLCLALGIGVNTSLLGVLDLLLLRPPAHVRDAARLQRVYFRESREESLQAETSYPAYLDLARVGAFSGTGLYTPVATSMGRGESARKVRGVAVTASLLPLLGVEPERGRLFTAREADPRQPGQVALVSWEFWQHHLGGRAGVLGEVLPIGRGAYTVIGVLPRGFIGIDLDPVDVWLPIGAAGSLLVAPDFYRDRGVYYFTAVARLRPGVTPERAAAEATAAARLERRSPRADGAQISLGPVQVGRSLWGAPVAHQAAWLAGTAGAVLLIACFNVASLLIARCMKCRHEAAVRMALGADRLCQTRILIAEALVVALLGGLAALAVIPLAAAVIRAYLLPQATFTLSLLDGRLLAVLGALTAGAVLVSGLTPTLRMFRRCDLADSLHGGAHLHPPRRSRLRAAILVAQVALTVPLLLGAGLFLRSLVKALHLDLGLDTARGLIATIDLSAAGYSPAEVDALFARAVERVRHLPGVEKASLGAGVPFRSSFGTDLIVPGRPNVRGLAPGGVYYNAVDDDFLATLGIPLLRGRTLTSADRTARVAVVNETMARLLWPGEDALGRCFQTSQEGCTTVVGVAGDSRRVTLVEPPTMQFYIPLAQSPDWMTSRTLFARTVVAPELLTAAVRREVQAVDPRLPFVEVKPLANLLDPNLQPWRSGAALFSLFGLLALTLAAVGIFASVAHSVATHRRELGVRVALGARTAALFRTVIRWGLGPTLLGIAIGLVIAVAAGSYARLPLFDVSPIDPLAVAGTVGAVLLAALLASWLPSLLMKRIDPVKVLRAE